MDALGFLKRLEDLKGDLVDLVGTGLEVGIGHVDVQAEGFELSELQEKLK